MNVLKKLKHKLAGLFLPLGMRYIRWVMARDSRRRARKRNHEQR